MDSKSNLSMQDLMLEKLARWKAEKARKKPNADNGKASRDHKPMKKRSPLAVREARVVNHHIHTSRAEKISKKRSTGSSQTTGSKSTSGSIKSDKDERSHSNLAEKKLPVQELTMREKLELWKAQKQEKNKRTSSLTSSVKKEGPTVNLARVTFSSKTPLATRTPSYKGLAGGQETTAGDMPRKHLFKTPTPFKGKSLQPVSSSMHVSTACSREVKVNKNYTLATRAHPTDLNGNRLHVTRSSSTLDEPSKKRKAVTFLSTASVTPMRCSPRLQKNTPATPKQQWQDKKLDMHQRLEHWLASKGKTPSRYSHLLGFKNTPADRIRRSTVTSQQAKSTKAPPPVWHLDSETSTSLESSSTSREEDEMMSALNSTMDECFLLLQSGCPTEHVSEWLDNLVDKVPTMRQCAKYWLCRVSIGQEEGRNANEIIHIYEAAVQECAQPIQEVKESLQQYVTTLISSLPSAPVTPITSPDTHTVTDPDPEAQTPRGSQYPAAVDHLLRSSVLRYCLTESTPYFDRIRAAVGRQAPATTTIPGSLRLVTPVRRSTRLEGRRSFLPLNLQDHDVCLASLGDLPSTGPQEFILRTNRALEGEFLEEEFLEETE